MAGQIDHGSLDARDADWLTGYPPTDGRDAGPVGLADRRELLEQALAVGRDLEQQALRGADGEPGWLVLKFLPEREQFALRAMEFDLYNGRCGLALFFAALERVAPGRGFGATAHATLAIVRRWLTKASDRELASLGLGGLTGLPSLAYALARAGSLLDDDGLLAEAAGAARRISPGLVAADQTLDVLGGAAGAVLCLLACRQACGDDGRSESPRHAAHVC